MVKSILVTGVNGFVGYHLSKELRKQGYVIYGTGMESSVRPALKSTVNHYIGPSDLTNPTSIKNIPLSKIDAVINLAGLAQVGSSFGQSEKYLHINVEVHTKLVSELYKLKKQIRIVAISTGAVYSHNQPLPLSEESNLITTGSPYALSKLAMEKELHQYTERGMDIVIARPFNHVGPGQMGGFIVPDLTKQVLKNNKVLVGNLNTERDYTDVRDVVKAYVILATKLKLKNRLYNICSGRSVSGKQLLDMIVDSTGKSEVEISVDKAKIRPDDPKVIYGDYSRLKNDTGWTPTIPINQTIKDYVKFIR